MLEKKAETFNMNRVIDEFDEMTRNADQVQKQTLKEILHKNKSAIYLRNFGINGDNTTDPEGDFKALVPLVTDSELEPYIKRMVDGDTSPILTGHPAPAISLSTVLPSLVRDPLQRPGPVRLRPFAHGLVHAFRTFEHVWEEIVTDIKHGVLSSRITVPSVRTAMSKLLTAPNPELAETIRDKCLSLSNWYGLIPALFPNAKYVYGIMTGSMEPYVKKLRHYAGDLPLVSHDYGSSEGWIAANVTPRLSPEEATFAVIPNLGYFEFLLVSETGEGEQEPVGLTEVKVGREYEVVLTNYAGLYRYRLGDVVKIMSFYNKTPQLKFVCRRNLILSINIDKNTERDLQLSVESAAKRLSEEKIEVIDFSSHVDLSTEPGHYVIFWEISGETNEDVLQDCCNCLDKGFIDAGYMSSRKCKTIGALELRVLEKGTFKKIQEHFLGLGSSAGQFKMPRCVKPSNAKVLQILCENVVSRFFSTAFE
ncbi:hypothetical protein Bca52824_050161 [Brassica carinata]|uniref:Jasmonic acid-amido synthetase JAR1 n=1 Tax=Brassica carinata TaxID=52824 RepID=A0A8X7RMC4_BRACI|nr:hypothetical protein Bca52824_050161 [Brassica carinata]